MDFARHERWPGDGIELHVALAGTGPPVVLLHGFPESHATWRKQVPALVAAGFTVVAPDLRGYGASDKPHGIGAYRMGHLVADVAAVIQRTGAPRAHVVGHDWGGVVAWAFAATRPELVHRLAILNAPHAGRYARRMLRPPQLQRSPYVFFFQLPFLPERALAADDYASVRRAFRRGPRVKGAFSEALIQEFVDGLKQPYARTAALNYYRAGRRLGGLRTGAVSAPTLVLWGLDDPALDRTLLDDFPALAPDLRIHRYDGVAHWIQNEIPDEVNARLVEHFS
jgi:epoxide hydrolase 4